MRPGPISTSSLRNVFVPPLLEGRLDREGRPLVLVNGFLEFQWEGLEKMAQCDRSIYFQWGIGHGKALAAEGTIMARYDWFDLCLYVVKPNNLVDAQKKLSLHTGLNSQLLVGKRERRDKILASSFYEPKAILIFNAEKFNEDKDFMIELVESRNVLVLFDEMPTKYSNRDTLLYKNTAEILYTSHTTKEKKVKGKKVKYKLFYPRAGFERPKGLFVASMSATPITKNPEGFYNSLRMMDPGLAPSVTEFYATFVAKRDNWHRPIRWRNLDKLAEIVDPIMHHADKDTDPRIAAMFPAMIEDTVYVDLHPEIQKLYDRLQLEYGNIGLCSILDYTEILSAIQVFQMLCNDPRAVLKSAERESNEVAMKFVELVGEAAFKKYETPKILKVQELLEEYEKALIFSSLNELTLPYVSEWLEEWDVPHVVYHGELTPRQKEVAKESFKNDPAIRVFLSSDAGGTSIDLPQASLKTDYDIPWGWARKKQRNRHDRIDSLQDTIRNVELVTVGTMEIRKLEVNDQQHGYHQALFGGEAQESSPDAKAGLLYVLTGQHVLDTEDEIL